MKLFTLDQLTDKELFFKFCKTASLDTTQLAASNMWHDNWVDHNHTLPYLLFRESRFSNPTGEFFLLEDAGEIIGCSGVYVSNFSKDVVIAGCRLWISKNYRNQTLPREYFLPAQKAWAIENNYKAIALTFNEYNKNIIELWKRKRLGESRTPRQPHHMFYKNLNTVDHSVILQYTPQWVIYEKLDDSFEFDWKTLK